jgi:tetratricopeptide (TPR) repeat protein
MTEHLSAEQKRALEAAERLVQARDYVAAETILASLPPVAFVVERRSICLSRTGRWRDVQKLLLPLQTELPAHMLLLLAEAILRSRYSFGDRSTAEDVAFAFERLIGVATAPVKGRDADHAVMLLAMNATATPATLVEQLTNVIQEHALRTPDTVAFAHALDTLADMGDRLPYLERARALQARFNEGARSACVGWRIGMLFHWAGDHRTALQWIDSAIASATGGTSDPAALRVAKAELLVLNHQPREALALLEELLDGEVEAFHAAAHLAALRAAAASSDPEGLGRRAKALAAYLAADPYRALYRFSDPFDILELSGPAWVVPQRWYTQSDPRPIADQLAAIPDREASAWMRFLVVSMRDNCRESGDESDDVPSAWISYLAGAAEATGHHPVLVGHEAFLRMRAPRPNWRALGMNWMAASLDVRQAGASSLWYLPSRLSEEPEHMSRFAEGVAKALRVRAPAPDAYDIIVEEAELAAKLVSHKLHRFLLAVMKPITANDQRAGPWFQLGYALHSLDKHAEALRAYAITLKDEPAHFSATLNSLLICCSDVPPLSVAVGFRVRG